ncbi:molybdenum cofactor guanylyltransferase MobA [Thalassobius sp. I31.1]|uniref:molybdenum cofactor guanylyltransferase MobA n=1 Tax=Thalassobius sp. I31.1 TaxID=2109912 RepID=UPI000D1A0E75|nr:molybdenum cofactor guanylyltransferase MobA [Thalassobius sp. I31.1]
MKSPLGVILAGGQATRMGGSDENLVDKGLMQLGGRVILDHVLARFEPQVAQVVLNANGDAARFDAFNLPVIADAPGDLAGPLAGILAGLDYAAEHGFDHIVTAAADTPFLPLDLVPQLQLRSETTGAPVVLSATPCPERKQQRQPTFGLWSVDLRDDLRAALSDGLRKIVAFTQPRGNAYAEFALTGDVNPFFNVNTPEDLAQAHEILKG